LEDNLCFAIAEFKVSKDDLYSVNVITVFKTYDEALAGYNSAGYDKMNGGIWQERISYEIIELRNGIKYYLNGSKISTILD